MHADNDLVFRAAARDGYTRVAEVLLYHGANLHAKADDALYWATINGHTGMVALLLTRPGHTIESLRAVLSRLQRAGIDENDAVRSLQDRMLSLASEALEQRIADAGLPDAADSGGALGL